MRNTLPNIQGIPRIIHQIWWNWQSIPDVPHAGYRARWQRLHPGYAYRFWGQDESSAYVARHFPQWVTLFNSYPRPIQRCDLFRILLLSREGGIYSDVDVYPLHPAETVLEQGRFVALVETHEGNQRRLANYWMAAAPNHPLLAEILTEMAARSVAAQAARDDDAAVLFSTGPDVITTVLAREHAKHSDLVVVPMEQARAFAMHRNDGTWRLARPFKSVTDDSSVVDSLRRRGLIADLNALRPASLAAAGELRDTLTERDDLLAGEARLLRVLTSYLQAPLPDEQRLRYVVLRIRQLCWVDFGSPLGAADAEELRVLQDRVDALGEELASNVLTSIGQNG